MYTKHFDNGLFTHYQGPKGTMPEKPGNTDYDQMILDIAEDPTCITEVDDTPVPTVDECRIAGYGPIGDQLDMQYHDVVNATTTWLDHIAAVKLAFPKI